MLGQGLGWVRNYRYFRQGLGYIYMDGGDKDWGESGFGRVIVGMHWIRVGMNLG